MKEEDILFRIIEHKRVEVEIQKAKLPLEELKQQIANVSFPKRSMRAALENSSSGIIAEFKRRSPSKGWIKEDAKTSDIVPGYEKAGASACSILTDKEFFGGTLDDLATVRPLVNLPLLRKEFIIDSYQLFEAKKVGADAILLIAACLTKEECLTLAKQAHELQLEVLLEIHTEDELEHLNPFVDMLGVNNRNLGTFHTDIQISIRLAKVMQQKCASFAQVPLLISESGLSYASTIKELREVGFRGFLMGESFMRNEIPADALNQLTIQFV